MAESRLAPPNVSSVSLSALEFTPSRDTPGATIARLPGYLRALAALADAGIATVSSGTLAQTAGVSPAQLRKDLSYLGSYGTRGIGYDVAYLQFQIGREVGSTQLWPVIIVGLGNLGRALAHYTGFGARGFRVVALVDAAPDQVGRRIDDLTVLDVAQLEQTVASTGARIAVVATPAEAAQGVCDRLVAAGVTSILNFAPSVLSVPESVTVRKVDLGQELQILAYHESRRADPLVAPVAEPATPHPGEGTGANHGVGSIGAELRAPAKYRAPTTHRAPTSGGKEGRRR
ncbi:MAG: redox-sensing transcriptional repressor Rex [Propionibacteriaceae bacterium]